MVLLSGGFFAAQHYMGLAGAFSDAFSVFVPDRRGRGMSGPPGDRYSMASECEYVEALLTATGARFVWGHSSCRLVALRVALTAPQIRKVAVYVPPLVRMYSRTESEIGKHGRRQSSRVHTAPPRASTMSRRRLQFFRRSYRGA